VEFPEKETPFEVIKKYSQMTKKENKKNQILQKKKPLQNKAKILK